MIAVRDRNVSIVRDLMEFEPSINITCQLNRKLRKGGKKHRRSVRVEVISSRDLADIAATALVNMMNKIGP